MNSELTDTRGEIPKSLRLSQLVVALRTLAVLRSNVTQCEELYGVLAVQLRAMLLDARKDSPSLLFSVFASYGEECCVFVNKGPSSEVSSRENPQPLFGFINPFVSKFQSDISTKEIALKDAINMKCLTFSGASLTLGEAIKRRAEVMGGAHYARLWRPEDVSMRRVALGPLHKCILAVCDAVLEAGFQFARKHTDLTGSASIKIARIGCATDAGFEIPGIFSVRTPRTATIFNFYHPTISFSTCLFICPVMGLTFEVIGAHGDKIRVATGYCPLPGSHQVILFRIWLDKEFFYNVSIEILGAVAASEKGNSLVEFVFCPADFLFSFAAAERQWKASSVEFSIDVIRVYGVVDDRELTDIRQDCVRRLEDGMSSDAKEIGGTSFCVNGEYFLNPETNTGQA